MPLTTLVYDQYHISVDCQTSFLYHSVVSHMIHESYLVLCTQSSLNIQILQIINYQVNEISFQSCFGGGGWEKEPRLSKFEINSVLTVLHPRVCHGLLS